VTGWLVPSASQKIPAQPGLYLPSQKILLAENRFLQTGKGAENTKEKSMHCAIRDKKRFILNILLCNQPLLPHQN